ncbi:MarR family winged helix-turn-helix transcriptional regulator [Ornithinimicrobium pekingense]|uniref:HTH marR-type domain-containing protein n=1 Tax=Ornithinimicrobium pekingense TaxID=384677 RepID=A0ABQ2F7N1_9MICO|nr:MarR family transcriptional regulator [Ornithinimicrobium pekingense]GGK60295.1 hypothetical protein GCM10011509_05780 [Ornithinimicrobium pekingense]
MDLATLMLISYRAMDERIVGTLQRDGYEVTVAQARIAQRLAPEGSRLTDLARQAQVTKQTASLVVAGLERAGLVERVPDPVDGRARIIRLTSRGRAASRRAAQVAMEVEREWEGHLGPELAGQLRTALLELREVNDPYR